MTKEDEELLLKDLCARLPYGVKFETKYTNHKNIVYELFVINKYCKTVETNGAIWWNLEEIKPYLRPMSSMTDKEKEQERDLWIGADTKTHATRLIDFYNKHHLDYRGLIPMGLALEAPKGMYDFSVQNVEELQK